MSEQTFSDEQLLAWLDELLPVEQMTAVEQSLRRSEPLRRRAASLNRRRDQGLHSVGEIWRRQRLSCPSRSDLGNFLLGTLEAGQADYVDFHIRTVGCRLCAANLDDLQRAMQSDADAPHRRRKFFESSAGYLRRQE